MSLTTQPSALSPTTGMHLHFFILGNSAAGNIVIAGKDATPAQNTRHSITYHVPIAPQNCARLYRIYDERNVVERQCLWYHAHDAHALHRHGVGNVWREVSGADHGGR